MDVFHVVITCIFITQYFTFLLKLQTEKNVKVTKLVLHMHYLTFLTEVTEGYSKRWNNKGSWKKGEIERMADKGKVFQLRPMFWTRGGSWCFRIIPLSYQGSCFLFILLRDQYYQVVANIIYPVIRSNTVNHFIANIFSLHPAARNRKFFIWHVKYFAFVTILFKIKR